MGAAIAAICSAEGVAGELGRTAETGVRSSRGLPQALSLLSACLRSLSKTKITMQATALFPSRSSVRISSRFDAAPSCCPRPALYVPVASPCCSSAARYAKGPATCTTRGQRMRVHAMPDPSSDPYFGLMGSKMFQNNPAILNVSVVVYITSCPYFGLMGSKMFQNNPAILNVSVVVYITSCLRALPTHHNPPNPIKPRHPS